MEGRENPMASVRLPGDDVNRTRVVLVSHEASRTGAPRVAMNVARALSHSGYEVVTVLRIGGPLAPEFEAASHRVVHEPLTRLRVVLRYFRRTRPLATRLEQRAARRVLRRARPAVVYLNSVKSACYVRPALQLGIPPLLHVHEGEPLASSTLARYRLGGLYERVRLAACSDDARDNLARISGVNPAAITVIPSLVDFDWMVTEARLPSPGATSVPAGTLVVGACGTADRRKGADLWLEMAAHISSARPDLLVKFRWVGKVPDRELRRLGERLGIGDRVELVGELANPYPALAAMDVFTLPSRDEPFGMVVLEAMALGRPVVVFALPAVVAQVGDAGVVVPPGDVRAMAVAVLELLDHPGRRRELGALAAERVRTHFPFERLREDVARVVADVLTSRGTVPNA
jgi:glycosyltransferase involved in cell wall biosynthesis